MKNQQASIFTDNLILLPTWRFVSAIWPNCFGGTEAEKIWIHQLWLDYMVTSNGLKDYTNLLVLGLLEMTSYPKRKGICKGVRGWRKEKGSQDSSKLMCRLLRRTPILIGTCL